VTLFILCGVAGSKRRKIHEKIATIYERKREIKEEILAKHWLSAGKAKMAFKYIIRILIRDLWSGLYQNCFLWCEKIDSFVKTCTAARENRDISIVERLLYYSARANCFGAWGQMRDSIFIAKTEIAPLLERLVNDCLSIENKENFVPFVVVEKDDGDELPWEKRMQNFDLFFKNWCHLFSLVPVLEEYFRECLPKYLVGVGVYSQ